MNSTASPRSAPTAFRHSAAAGAATTAEIASARTGSSQKNRPVNAITRPAMATAAADAASATGESHERQPSAHVTEEFDEQLLYGCGLVHHHHVVRIVDDLDPCIR